jgi:hypothetical protein
MDAATQSHLTTLRGELEYQLAGLLSVVRAAELRRGVANVGGNGDVVSGTCDATAEVEERGSLDDVRLVEAALHRLDIGRYGDCADCGEPIGLQRLLVLPAAEHCAACQAAVERHIRDAIGRGA